MTGVCHQTQQNLGFSKGDSNYFTLEGEARGRGVLPKNIIQSQQSLQLDLDKDVCVSWFFPTGNGKTIK